MSLNDFVTSLLEWYRLNGRQLPWRDHPDPYAIWISEIMLHQTRVETVIPYFSKWMEQFPDVETLASASQQQVLMVWEGLGYYTRARNLHRSAQIIVAEHAGRLPRDIKTLQTLPGIGRYTAGAIASIAYGLDEPALDGNIRRVLSRLFNMHQSLGSTQSERELWGLARNYLPHGKAGDYNQALMDLGALLCTPRNPACNVCPVDDLCRAHALGLQERIPVKKKKPLRPHHNYVAALIRNNGNILLSRRPSEGLLGGMWEFPGGRLGPQDDPIDGLVRLLQNGYGINAVTSGSMGSFFHAYTHFRLTIHAFECNLKGDFDSNDLEWIPIEHLSEYPMGKVYRQIAERLSHE